MSNKKYIDDKLVDWGDDLFGSKLRSIGERKKRGTTGIIRKINKSNESRADRANQIRNNLVSITRRTPQVLVKVSGGGKGMRQIYNHFSYITRNGELEFEDQDGSFGKGVEDVNSIREEWQYGGFAIPEEGEYKDAFNIVLSMPDGTNVIGLKRAVREFAKNEFHDHQYIMVLHTYETDPDPKPSKNPHVHLCVKAKSNDGIKLRPRKNDLQRWREDFALKLRDFGIDAAATKREQRLNQQFRGEKLSVKYMKKRGVKLDKIGKSPLNKERVKKAKNTESRIIKAYQGIINVLSESDDVTDRQLSNNLSMFLRSKNIDSKKERGNTKTKDKELELN